MELAVYDTDGQPGIFIPNSMEMNAVREVAANMVGSLGSSINISTNAGAQLASDLGNIFMTENINTFYNFSLQKPYHILPTITDTSRFEPTFT